MASRPLSCRLRRHLRWRYTEGVGRWRVTCARCDHIDLGALTGSGEPRTWITVDNTRRRTTRDYATGSAHVIGTAGLPPGFVPPSASLRPPEGYGYLCTRDDLAGGCP